MKCLNCGKELKDDWKKCPYCGQEIFDKTVVEKKDNEIIYEKRIKKNTVAKLGSFFVIVIAIGVIILSGKKSDPIVSTTSNKEVEQVVETGEIIEDSSKEQSVLNNTDKEEENVLNRGNLTLQQISPYGYVYAYDYLEEYSNEYGIEICRAENVTKQLNKRTLLEEKPHKVYLCSDRDTDEYFYYGIEMDAEIDKDLYYFGKMKNNKPEGFGIICEIVGVSIDEIEYEGVNCYDIMHYDGIDSEWIVYKKIYAGYFHEGQYNGEGILYYLNEELGLGEFYLSEEGIQLFEGDLQKMIDMFGTPIKYIGNFKNGKFDGWGTELTYYDDDYDDVPHICEVRTGTYKDDLEYGIVKDYMKGYLFYEGEKVDGRYHGYGEKYYNNSNEIEYKGEFNCGVPDGQGTYYHQISESTEDDWEDEYEEDEYEEDEYEEDEYEEDEYEDEYEDEWE